MMEKYTNEFGKECWRGVTLETPLSEDLFHEPPRVLPEDRQLAFHSNLGSLTILNRLTGFGWRDVETGYRDNDGNFWLASGGHDIRREGIETVGDAIAYVKKYANTCNPSLEGE